MQAHDMKLGRCTMAGQQRLPRDIGAQGRTRMGLAALLGGGEHDVHAAGLALGHRGRRRRHRHRLHDAVLGRLVAHVLQQLQGLCQG